MAELFGKNYDKASLMRRVGNLAQVAGISEYTYNSGRAAGVKAVRVDTGALSFELLPDRCLDVSRLSFKGVPVGYFSKSGIRHPAYYSKVDPSGFLDNFFAGALSTCGLDNIGPAREAGGRVQQQHGNIGNMPAEIIAVGEGWDGDECVFVVRGEVHHSSFYHGDMILRRTVTARLGGTSLGIVDEVENLDFAPAPCLLLYHCQFGFPLLDAATRLVTSPTNSITPRRGTPDEAVKDCAGFVPPKDGEVEQCFYHAFKADAQGRATACLFNPELGAKGLGAYVRFHTDTLPLMTQWKMLRSREYVCGLEPVTARLDERDDAAHLLQPLEKRTFRLELGCVEGEGGLQKLLA